MATEVLGPEICTQPSMVEVMVCPPSRSEAGHEASVAPCGSSSDARFKFAPHGGQYTLSEAGSRRTCQTA